MEEVNSRAGSADAVPIKLAILTFEVAGWRCALPVCDVREIVPLPELARAPGESALIAGFMNLRGAAVPVLDAARLFGLRPSPRTMHTPLIVLNGSEAVLLVDRVFNIARVLPASLLPVPLDSCFNNCTAAQVETEHGVVNLLSRDRLLLEKERQYLAEVRAEAQRRMDELEGRRP